MVTTARALRTDGGSASARPARNQAASSPAAPLGPTREALAAARLVAALAVTIPIAWVTVGWAAPGNEQDWTRRVSLAPFDLILVAALIWAATHREAMAGLFARRSVRLAVGAQAVVTLVALAAHPSWLGLDLVLRLIAGLAVIAAVGVATSHERGRCLVLGSLTAVGVFQAVLGMAQSLHGTAFGIEFIDFVGPLYPFGNSRAGRGGLTHPYHLAVLLVVAQGAALLGARQATQPRNGPKPTNPAPLVDTDVDDQCRVPVGEGFRHEIRGGEGQVGAWLFALVVIGAGIGVTYSRAGVIGQTGLVLVLLLGRADRRTMRMAAAAIVIGLAFGATAFGNGWIAKAEQTSGSDPGSNRGTRVSEALDLIEDQPIVGAGPGRYVTVLAETDRAEYLPAHNLLLHQAAELGVVGALTTAALCLLLAYLALRGGAWPVALLVPMLPYLGLDAYPYVFGTGLALSALWLGLVRLAAQPLPPNLKAER